MITCVQKMDQSFVSTLFTFRIFDIKYTIYNTFTINYLCVPGQYQSVRTVLNV